MIERHLRKLEDRLTAVEKRDILGERISNAGRIAFARGDFVRGAMFMLRAALLGYRPLSSFATLAKAPLAAIARRVLARRRTAF
jgi:hypothetical protein